MTNYALALVNTQTEISLQRKSFIRTAIYKVKSIFK